jgi:predicted O-methyltransferase YrrM
MDDGTADLDPLYIEVTKELKLLQPEINAETVRVLSDMYSASFLDGTESQKPVELIKDARISISQGAQINQIMRSRGVRRSLEIGFGYGFSTVWMLDALSAQRDTCHVAIDPFEKTYLGGVGLRQVERLPYVTKFEWIEDYSIHALSRFIKQKTNFDFIFVDGNHRFDDVLVDFYLSDQLLSPGGIIAFDDMWMASVRTVISFIETNRQYEVVAQPIQNMVVLEKKTNDERDWAHFEHFKVHSELSLKNFLVRVARQTGTYNLLRELRTYVKRK